jgi:hypothetical protein
MECVDKKTGLQKSSLNIEESKQNDVFNFPLTSDTKTLVIDHERVLNIKSVWVENSWSYECVNNRAVLVKKKTQQFVIDYKYDAPENDSITLCLWKLNEKSGSCLGSTMRFSYNGEDTLKLVLRDDNRRELEILKFWKKK